MIFSQPRLQHSRSLRKRLPHSQSMAFAVLLVAGFAVGSPVNGQQINGQQINGQQANAQRIAPLQSTTDAKADSTDSSSDSSHPRKWYTRKTSWHGFDQFHFKSSGRDAYLVVPDKPLQGNPWIWRARFPGFHAEMDIELVRLGFHLAYFDVANQFGSPAVVKQGTDFYENLVRQHALSPKPVLEGVSRGGLFVYNWAAMNPDRVSCIYCDTPVLDFHSWPGGEGSGVGSAAAWKACLAAYGMTEAEAKVFDQQPIDHAEVIARAKFPILHIVSESDRVVPPSENTYRLKAELQKLGRTMEIISVAQGTAKSKGHHFVHPDPNRVIQFIRQHAEGAGATPTKGAGDD